MISVTDLKAGSAFTEDGNLYKVTKYEFCKMGRGTATIKVKIKNMKTGSTTEKSFISGARVQEANLEKVEVQYLYKQGDEFMFMDPVTFEQFSINKNKIEEEAKFLQEGLNVWILMYGDEPISLELPIKMDFMVEETDPGVKGNSATNSYKDAVLKNGLRVRVPLFIKEGELIRVDTRNGEYIERANK